jgi:hypothetical protein
LEDAGEDVVDGGVEAARAMLFHVEAQQEPGIRGTDRTKTRAQWSAGQPGGGVGNDRVITYPSP